MKVPCGKGEAKSFIRKALRDLWQKKRQDADIKKGDTIYSIQKPIKVKACQGKCRRGSGSFKVKTGLKSTL